MGNCCTQEEGADFDYQIKQQKAEVAPDDTHFPNTDKTPLIESMNRLHPRTKEVLFRLPEYENPLSIKYSSLPEGGPYHFKEDSGATYKGNFKDGKREGFGICIYNDGSIYEGYWHKNNRDGQGRYVNIDGDVYEGYWDKGVRHGKGKCISYNETYYDGVWKCDVREGFGTETYEDESVYKGNFQNDCRNGQGVLRWKSGKVYKGNFTDDMIDGEGEFPPC